MDIKIQTQVCISKKKSVYSVFESGRMLYFENVHTQDMDTEAGVHFIISNDRIRPN